MSLFSKLFGKRHADASQPASVEEYKGFRIYPEPEPTGQQFRVAARIEKEIGGETRTHHLIRADVLELRDAAVAVSLTKAKQTIDEQGDALFG